MPGASHPAFSGAGDNAAGLERVYDLLSNKAENATDRQGNSNIEDGMLSAFLLESGHSAVQASRVLRVPEALHRENDNPNRSLMANNQAVY